jgi:TonB-dependent receptor
VKSYRRSLSKMLNRTIKFFFLLNLFMVSIFAQQTGGLTGRVIDQLTENPLPGASVKIEGTSQTAETDRTGAFQILRIPTGKQTVVISYLGFETKTEIVEIKGGELITLNLSMESGIKETVTVSAPLLEGQSRALNQQKEAVNIQNIVSADQIGRFPDPNSAEAAQRIPGITIERDQGEGRYVQVRGTEARLNSMMINGERIPSPEGDVRSAALDVIPADLLESIEVSKALTADMDADSIGGAVNLITKGAPEKTRVSLTAGFGYNRISEGGIQNFNGTVGRRFADKKAGLLFSASFLNTNRGSEGFEPVYDDGDLDELDLRDYTINRKRWGINPVFDYRFSPTSEIYVRGIYNKFNDQEFRRRVRYRLGNGRIERELKDRFESQNISQIAGGGRNLLGNLFQLDYKFSYGYAEEAEPDRVDTTFEQRNVIFNPNVSPTSIDPNNIQANPTNESIAASRFTDLVNENNFTSEKDFNAQVNGSIPWTSGKGFAGVMKFGFKNRYKRKLRDNEAIIFEFPSSSQRPFLNTVLDTDFTQSSLLNGLYPNFNSAFVNPTTARNLRTAAGVESEKDFEGDSANYRVRENVLAFYGLTELHFGDKFLLLPGIRFERTSGKYNGFTVLFDDGGDYLSTTEVPRENSYNHFLPSLHARFKIAQNTNLRAAYTRTLARPNYRDLTPFQIIFEEDLEIERGNTSLVPTTSDNFDVLAEHYLGSVGVISGGFFYKRLNQYIYPFTFNENRLVGGTNETFRVLQPLNGDKADLYGFELAFQNRFSFLPKPLDGLGVYANYTYVTSDTLLPGEDLTSPGRKSILPGQAKNVANFALSYEKFGFSGRGSLHYRDLFLSEVAGSPADDIFVDKHLQFDLSMSQRITKNFRVFAEFINLNNRPFRRYQGTPNRPVQQETYRWWATFGVKLDW